MATFGNATSGLFDVVAQTSNTLVSAVNTISGGIGMLNDYVTAQRDNQTMRLAAESVNYGKTLATQAALDAYKRERQVREIVGNDEAAQKTFNEHYTAILDAVNNAIKPKAEA